MRTTQYLLSTLKEKPQDAKIISHQLMLRSGMIRQLSSGIYIWLPTGIRVIKKIKKIIEQEMNKINAIEILMPIIQPSYLWEKSGRLNTYGEELFKFYDRQKNQFILGPTNEEVITHFISNTVYSYKKLPLIIYQIQEKFRDEIRPRFGVIRSREFIMKDAYSFHLNKNCLQKTYSKIYNSYLNIFKKIPLNVRAVKADSGSIGGDISHEFQALCKSGEDKIVFSDKSSYASNINMAQSMESINFFKNKNNYHYTKEKKISKKIKIKKQQLTTPINNQVKTFLIRIKNKNIISIAALLIRKDHTLNICKIEKIDMILKPLKFLNEKEIFSLIGTESEFLGPLGLNIPIISDISVYKMQNFTIGANNHNKFFINVNWHVDLPITIVADIRTVTEKDMSPDGKDFLNIHNSIEIGHIFQLGTKYSKTMNAFVQQKNEDRKNIHMGCYGIGITRIIAAYIEQNHDENGIIWTNIIAPFEVVIIPINMHKYIKIKELANTLYQKMKKNKIDVILDDRNQQPGIMFSEMDLIGIPHQIIISERYIHDNNIEYRDRSKKNTSIIVKITDIIKFIKNKIKK